MGRGVFIHRSDSIYDDSPAERYQFPRQYLGRVQACVGDWIVYYEPRKVRATRGYFAAAKVQEVIPDPGTLGMYLAVIEPGSYLEFPAPVAFAGPDGVVEQGVLNEAGRISGRAQAAVRPLSLRDFNRIVGIGLGDRPPLLPRLDGNEASDGLSDPHAPFVHEVERDRALSLTSRLVRDPAFRTVVLRAYDERCAFTGLKLINGGGRAEVEAAHIRPVEAGGPDDVRNGLALCGTAHWMLDRGLVGLTDDLRIIISRKVNDPDGVRAIINKDGYARHPQRPSDRPHPSFLNWHRERFELSA